MVNTLVLFLVVLACIGMAWVAGWAGAAVVETLGRLVLFVVRHRVVGLGQRRCIPCGRVANSMLHRRGRWTCLACMTPHPDPTARR